MIMMGKEGEGHDGKYSSLQFQLVDKDVKNRLFIADSWLYKTRHFTLPHVSEIEKTKNALHIITYYIFQSYLVKICIKKLICI